MHHKAWTITPIRIIRDAGKATRQSLGINPQLIKGQRVRRGNADHSAGFALATLAAVVRAPAAARFPVTSVG
jgi:hypothetical protein